MEGAAADPYARDLAAARVHNVLLGTASAPDPHSVVERLLCVQAQEHAFSRWSVAQRTARPDEAAVLAAIATSEVVRTHVLRPTWHYVLGADLRWLQALTGPRVRALSAGWYRNHGVDDDFFLATRKVIEAELTGGKCRTRDELKQALSAADIDVSGQRLVVALFDLELQAVICSGPVRGRHHTYGLVDELLPPSAPRADDEATALLVERYLRGHGPALLKDLRWWSSLTLKQLQRGVEDLGDAVVSTNVGGAEYLRLADQPAPTGTAAADRQFRLLQVFDELFVGYSESRGLVDPDGEFGSVLPIGFSKMMHVVLEGDRLAGRWRSDKREAARGGGDASGGRRRAERRTTTLEITAAMTRPLSATDRRALERSVEAYGAFVGTAATLALRDANTR